jgi:hypothetical protein
MVARNILYWSHKHQVYTVFALYLLLTVDCLVIVGKQCLSEFVGQKFYYVCTNVNHKMEAK